MKIMPAPRKKQDPESDSPSGPTTRSKRARDPISPPLERQAKRGKNNDSDDDDDEEEDDEDRPAAPRKRGRPPGKRNVLAVQRKEAEEEAEEESDDVDGPLPVPKRRGRPPGKRIVAEVESEEEEENEGEEENEEEEEEEEVAPSRCGKHSAVGGVFRGNRERFDLADAEDMMEDPPVLPINRVVFKKHDAKISVQVRRGMTEVLKRASRKWPSLAEGTSARGLPMLLYVWENGDWTSLGPYATAAEDDETIKWEHAEDGTNLIHILQSEFTLGAGSTYRGTPASAVSSPFPSFDQNDSPAVRAKFIAMRTWLDQEENDHEETLELWEGVPKGMNEFYSLNKLEEWIQLVRQAGAKEKKEKKKSHKKT
ncbi:hypothetical protein DFP72DRAFT_1069924 [Ephemerocybe angulata]|uniref:Uncharacterized protein n=1 Tax=Ephemerocybe angulata TaxID=980116 RepID=A0A8H6HTX9_9AGAR|nr:hypothetical protein DFP72DRAFT_1069924 [Tulosesus angulatus]